VNPRVVAVLRKELREYRRNKFVVGTMIVLPVIFVIIPIGNVLAIRPSMSPDAVRATVGGVTLTLFFVPLILPATLSAYAVIGERDQGTLEPVLTTPVTREELLLGKALAILVPTVAVSYGLYIVFLLVIRAAAAPAVVDLEWQAGQASGVVLFAPLLATYAVWVGIAWSTRSSDVRVAQQLSVLATLPMLGVTALFSFRIIDPSLVVAGGGAVVLGAIDVVGWLLVSAMFDRERLLTRYGGS
jgi:ABC-type Na+ efflux pump permease subunit